MATIQASECLPGSSFCARPPGSASAKVVLALSDQPLPKKKKNKAAQAQRVQLAIGAGGVASALCAQSTCSVQTSG